MHDISLTIPGQARAGRLGRARPERSPESCRLRPSRGNRTLDGHEFSALRSVAAGIRHGIVLIPEDRKSKAWCPDDDQPEHLVADGLPPGEGRLISRRQRKRSPRRRSRNTIRPADPGKIAGQPSRKPAEDRHRQMAGGRSAGDSSTTPPKYRWEPGDLRSAAQAGQRRHRRAMPSTDHRDRRLRTSHDAEGRSSAR